MSFYGLTVISNFKHRNCFPKKSNQVNFVQLVRFRTPFNNANSLKIKNLRFWHSL
jgi:hypothetical protein